MRDPLAGRSARPSATWSASGSSTGSARACASSTGSPPRRRGSSPAVPFGRPGRGRPREGPGRRARPRRRARRRARPGARDVFWTFPHDRKLRPLAAPGPGLRHRRRTARRAPAAISRPPTRRRSAPPPPAWTSAASRSPTQRSYPARPSRGRHDGTPAVAAAGDRPPGAGLLARSPSPATSSRSSRCSGAARTSSTAAAARRRPPPGAAVATFHELPAPAGLEPFTRLRSAAPRPTSSAAAGPTSPRPPGASPSALEAAAPPTRPRVCLHGDVHPKNAIDQDDGVAMIDLDQASLGPAAAELGSVLAGCASHALLAGGLDRAPRPAPARGLRWRATRPCGRCPTPPAALARRRRRCSSERALRAVNRAAPRRARPPRRHPRRRPVRPGGPVVSRPSGCWHCQHSLGLGHLARSLALADALTARLPRRAAQRRPLPDGVRGAGRRRARPLPPLSMGTDGVLVNPQDDRPVEAVQDARRAQLLQLHDAVRPDVVLVELFPFGRRSFKGELLPLLEARARGRRRRVACSLRDILVGRAPRPGRATTSARPRSPTRSSTPCSCTPTRASRAWRSRFRPRRRCACPSTTRASSRRGRPPRPRPRRREPASSSRPAAAPRRAAPARRRRGAPAAPRRRASPMTSSPGRSCPPPRRDALRAAAARPPGLEVARRSPTCAPSSPRRRPRSASAATTRRSTCSAPACRRWSCRSPTAGEDEQTRRAERLARLGALRVLAPRAADRRGDGAASCAAAGRLRPRPPASTSTAAAASARLLAGLAARRTAEAWRERLARPAARGARRRAAPRSTLLLPRRRRGLGRRAAARPARRLRRPRGPARPGRRSRWRSDRLARASSRALRAGGGPRPCTSTASPTPNHEPAPAASCEFGPHAPRADQRADLAHGRRCCSSTSGRCCDPIFTPPWNRCTAATRATCLVELGFARPLARLARRAARRCPASPSSRCTSTGSRHRKGVRRHAAPSSATRLAARAARGGAGRRDAAPRGHGRRRSRRRRRAARAARDHARAPAARR